MKNIFLQKKENQNRTLKEYLELFLVFFFVYVFNFFYQKINFSYFPLIGVLIAKIYNEFFTKKITEINIDENNNLVEFKYKNLFSSIKVLKINFENLRITLDDYNNPWKQFLGKINILIYNKRKLIFDIKFAEKSFNVSEIKTLKNFIEKYNLAL